MSGSSSRTVNFTIDVPLDGTPGGHYGAVFFKYNSSEASSGTTIGIGVDYGILVLVNVSGEVSSTGSVGGISISGSGPSYDRCNGDDTS